MSPRDWDTSLLLGSVTMGADGVFRLGCLVAFPRFVGRGGGTLLAVTLPFKIVRVLCLRFLMVGHSVR